MKSVNQSSILVLSLTAALLSGCGSNGVTGAPATTYAQDGEIYTPPVVIQSTGYGAYPLSFRTVGTSPAINSTPLRTDTMLKVKVTLSPATQNTYPAGSTTYSNYTANYTCATVQVTLQVEQNGTYVDFASVVTGRLTAAGTPGCAGSVASELIDFSSYMTPGHGNVKIKVQAITSNTNCTAYANGVGSWPWNYGQVCSSNPMQSIYQYHVVNGKMEVQVNGTSFVN